MGLVDLAELLERLVKRMTAIEIPDRRGGVGAEQVVIIVARHLRREHVLPRILVDTIAGESLLVAVVNHGNAAGEVHKGMSQSGAFQHFLFIGGAAHFLLKEKPYAADVMIAEESRKAVDVAVGVSVIVVFLEKVFKIVGGFAGADEAGDRALKSEVEHSRQPGAGRVEAEKLGVGVVHLAENKELGNALLTRIGDNRRGELLPEFGVDVFDGIQPKTVDPEFANPVFEDFDHARDDFGILGEQVVQSEEISVLRAFPAESTFAAVVVVDRIVQPRRHFYVLFILRNVRCVGPTGICQFGEVFFGLDRVAPEALIDRRTIDTAAVRVRVFGLGAVDAGVAGALLVGPFDSSS